MKGWGIKVKLNIHIFIINSFIYKNKKTMKKLLLLTKMLFAAALLCVGQNAWGDETIVGATDNSSNWWTSFSNDYTLADNQKLYLEFTNYTSDYDSETWKDWFNWAIIVKNDQDGHSDVENPSYAEYFAMNSANNSWGDCSVVENRYCKDYVWGEANRNRMNGANVKMTITRENGRVSIYALMSNTTQEGVEESPTLKSWSESTFFDLPAEAASQNIRVFLTVEKAHIVIDNSKTATTPTAAGYYTVGTTTKDVLFFSDFSDYYSVPANKIMKLHFKNYSLKGGNYQNWVAVLTNNKKRTEVGYSEYLVLRNDNWGWGTKYDAGTLTSNFDWGKFMDEMDGSDVVMTVTRSGADFTLYADITASDGITKHFEQFVGTCDANEELYFFLTTDHGYLSIQSLETAEISSYGWATFSSDYALDFSKATEGLEAYMITGHDGNVVTKSQVTGTVPAGTGLLLKGAAGSYNIPIVGSSSTDVSANKLVAGTGADISAVGGNTRYVLGVSDNGTAGDTSDDFAEFQKITETPATVAKGKAYLELEAGLARSMRFSGDVTAIENVEAAAEAKAKEGKFIENGKLVIVKNGQKFNAAGAKLY